MTDSEAIRLFVAEGNPREDWWALDERDRYPWRKKALEKVARAEPSSGPNYPARSPDL